MKNKKNKWPSTEKWQKNYILIISMYNTALDACKQPMTSFCHIKSIAEYK